MSELLERAEYPAAVDLPAPAAPAKPTTDRAGGIRGIKL